MAIDPKKLARFKKIAQAVNDSVKGASIIHLGSSERAELKRFSSQIPSLDDALGGGWPIGRVIEIYGGESTGKTTLCYHAIAEWQKRFPDDPVAWIDSEASIDAPYASKLGVNIEELFVDTPDTGEIALNEIKALIQNGVKLIVVDSVAALVPAAEREKAFGERTMGETARLMSTALRQLSTDVAKADAIIMFTNQVREKIGVTYGDKSTTPGGRALRFYSSIRLQLNPMGFEKEGEEVVCTKIKATCKKNKTAAPLKWSEYTITFGLGVDAIVDTFNTAVDFGIIEKSGSWFGYDKQRIGQGKAKALEFMRENPNLLEKMMAEVAMVKASGKNPALTLPNATTKSGKKFKMPKIGTTEDAKDSTEGGEVAESEESLDVETAPEPATAVTEEV